MFVVLLSVRQIALSQQDYVIAQQHKTDLEVQKLELEVAQLKKPNWNSAITVSLGILTVAMSALVSFLAARRAREGALDEATHEKRLDDYPKLVEATSPLAVYFPSGYPSAQIFVSPADCAEMGQTMSRWYFGGGGVLMSEQARDAYFRLARALTRAQLADQLKVPVFPVDSPNVSNPKLKIYREDLGKELKLDLEHVDQWTLDKVDQWNFDSSAIELENSNPAHRFRDYVFLQHLSSDLRTKLSEDLSSRRRPT